MEEMNLQKSLYDAPDSVTIVMEVEQIVCTSGETPGEDPV